MHDLTLLIQLFGREVMDNLLRAGFETNDAIARAGPERVSQDSSIPLPLARRIVAVAMESQALDEQDPPVPASPGKKSMRARRQAPAAPDAASSEHVRRPLRRPHSPLAAPVSEKIDEQEQADAEAREDAPMPPLDQDPFIDDVGVVTWMGFSARTGSGRMISVADAILDPREPRLEALPPAPVAPARPFVPAFPMAPAASAGADPDPAEFAAPSTLRPPSAPPAASKPTMEATPAAPISLAAAAAPISTATAVAPSSASTAAAPIVPNPGPTAAAPVASNPGPTAAPRPVTPIRPMPAKPETQQGGAQPRLVGGSFWGFGAIRPAAGSPPAAAPGRPLVDPVAREPIPPLGGARPRRRNSDER